MSLEEHVVAVLAGLAGDRVFPDFAPEGTARPYIVYQAVGGEAINFVDGALPGKRNARVQVAVWSDSRLEASSIVSQVEDAMRAAGQLQVTVLGAAVSTFDEETGYRGSRQDFSCWY
jgi:hypothetical protein